VFGFVMTEEDHLPGRHYEKDQELV